MTRVLLVAPLRLERWKAIDRYAAALAKEVPLALPAGWTVAMHPQPRYPRWSRFGARWLAYPRTIDWDAFDLVHVVDHSYAHVLRHRNRRTRTVLTVHDLFAFDPRSQKAGLRGAVLRRMNGWVLDGIRDADACVCDSRATMADVQARYPDVSDRVRHQTLGVDPRFFVGDGERRRRGREILGAGARSAVVLHVGSCVPRKNIEGLLAAIAQVTPGRRDVQLIQVGGRFTADQRRQIATARLEDHVRQIEHVPDMALPDVYSAADVVVVPSLFEGFGLPVLEAFAAGTPVVASRCGALAEFPAALMAPAGDGSPDEIAAAVVSVLDDPDGAAARAEQATRWARDFTWARTARAVADTYQALLS